MGKNDSFVVDTKNLCFLCFRPAKIVAAGVKRRVKDKTFSLRCISRYMDVDFQKMVKTVVPPTPAEGGVKFPQVLVTVCSRCSAVTEEFATLYQYMEFTQMKINACVRNINDLMRKTDNNSRLVDKFRKKMKVASDTDGADAVENMRKRMAEHCSSALQNAFPRVKMRRVGETGQSAKLVADAKPSPRSKKPVFASTILKKGPFRSNSKVSAVNEDIPDINSANEAAEKIELFQCLHCDNTFNDTGELRIHIVGYHREQFFQMFKSASISDEDFKVAVELLFQDVRKITANCGTQSTDSYVCSCCGKPFSAKIDTYVHMVQLHHDALSTKLQSFQKDASLLSSAKKTIKLPDPSNLHKRRRIRGPYKKKNGTGAASVNSSKATLISNKMEKKKNSQTTVQQTTLMKKVKNPMAMIFPRTCECGVQLSSRSSWNNHQRLHCKLKIEKLQIKAVPISIPMVQHPLLKRAKNTLGFPRTCACGVRLSLRTSWTNHQRMHCKLKFGPKSTVGSGAATVSTNKLKNTVKHAIKGAMKKIKGKVKLVPPVPAKRNVVESGSILNKATKYACECGSNLTNYQSWYHHTRKSCRLRTDDGANDVDLDYVEEVPIDITPSGELCLPSSSTSIETSPVPKITKVTSHGGVIKGLRNMANFQDRLKRETESKSATNLDTSLYTDLFSKYLPIGTSNEEIQVSLEKVLQDYRKFSGNISGCPWCGRGFTQVTELQTHMVEAHFEDVVSKLKSIVDPSGLKPCNFDGIVNLDPNLVKSENEMDIDVPANDLCATGSQFSHDFLPEPDYLTESDYGNIIPKEEQVSYPNDEAITHDADDQLLIVP